MNIRQLQLNELEKYLDLRLRSLQDTPHSFGRSFEDEAQRSTEERILELRSRLGEHNVIFIAEENGEFFGSTGILRMTGRKIQHSVIIWGVYVVPEARGKHIGRLLMERAVEQARQWEGVTQVKLTVVTTNQAALKLYESLGFQKWGVEPQALIVDGLPLDEAHFVLFLE
ncbi:MAG: GNAT family N-acetyltransferase [Chloroflexi bacterium]|nr:GNAT family N-acetyltransferase [Chloroflexota bacterium]